MKKQKDAGWLQQVSIRLHPKKTGDIFFDNEQQGNYAAALTLVVTELIYSVTLILHLLGVFKGRALMVAMTEGMILQLIPLTVYAVYGPEKRWMKNVLMGGMILSMAFIDAQLTYKTALLIAIPVAISVRYFSKETTMRVAVFSGFVFALSAAWGATHGLLDMNILDLPQNFTLYVEKRLVVALEEMGLPKTMLIRNSLVLSYIPKLFLFFIVAFASVQSADRGRQMILEQADISRVNTELSMAREIQMSNLPDPASGFSGRSEFRIFAAMDPAKEVGGDFYDFFLVDDDHLCLLIADVSDKGIPAALFMMSSKSTIKAEAMRGFAPKVLMETVNRLLCDNNPNGMFVSVWLGILEISTGKLTCVNAGHEYPFIRSHGGAFRLFRDKHGLVAGVMPKTRYTDYILMLEPGDAVFVYTDGVCEANDREGNMYGMERLENALNLKSGQVPTEIVRAVRRDVDAFVGDASQFDDLTMLCLEYCGPEDLKQTGGSDS